MSVAKATQGKGREIAHEKNICQSYTSDDNFIQKEEGFRVRRMGKIEGALKLLFLLRCLAMVKVSVFQMM